MSSRIRSGLILAVAAVALATPSAALGDTAPIPTSSMAVADFNESVEPAEVVASRRLYQLQRNFGCNAAGGCLAQFGTLTAKQRLELQNISCIVAADPGATVAYAVAQYAPTSKSVFLIPLSLGYLAVASGRTLFTFQQPTSAFVPPKKKLEIDILIENGGSAPSVTCQIYGQLVTLK